MPAPLSEQVIVITGASSGIGRATAVAAGKRGAAVALIARNDVALREAAAEVEAAGGKAFTVVTDVADREQVDRAAQATLQHFGRIDTWVNNAAVYTVAPVERMTTDEIEQVIRINFLGLVYGTKAVLPHFVEREQGTLIYISSIVGMRGAPLIAPYVASKHAIKGFSESLRLEMERDHPGVKVTLILPASINTPFFRHSLSRIGVKPRPFPPIYAPELVADAILDSAERPKRDVFVGTGRSLAATEGIAPGMLDQAMLVGGAAFRAQMTKDPDDEMNNLFAPMPPETYAVYGDWMDEMRRDSLTTRLFELHPLRTRALASAAGAALLLSTVRGIRKSRFLG